MLSYSKRHDHPRRGDTHPKIAEVQVVGVPDRKLGEAVAVRVRLRAGQNAAEEEIPDYCRGRIAHFKIPQYVGSSTPFR
jgi:fatty-acyl-CoA synthase